MKSLQLIGVLFLVVSFVGGLCFGAPEEAEGAREPDWSVVTGGNWSPWVVGEDGSREWNPAKGFNDWLATVPEEEKAWWTIAEMYFELGDVLDGRGDETHGILQRRPDENAEKWRQAVEAFGHPDISDAVARLLESFTLPFAGYPLMKSTDPVLSQIYREAGYEDWIERDSDGDVNPELVKCLSEWRFRYGRLSRFLIGAAMVQLEAGDLDGFIETVGRVMKSSQWAYEYPTIRNQMYAYAVQSRALDAVSWALEYHGEQFGAQHLEALDKIIIQNMLPDLDWRIESLIFHDLCRRMAENFGSFSPDGLNPNFQTVDDGLGLPSDLPFQQLHPSVQRTILLFEEDVRVRAEGRSLIWDDSDPGVEDVYELEKATVSSIGQMLIEPMLPAVTRGVQIRERLRAESSVARLVIAAHRSKIEHGFFPESLEQLDPDRWGISMRDGLNGKRLRYIRSESGPVIYSLGPDHTDDGGKHNFQIRTGSRSSDEIGDFVFYPHQWEDEDE